MDKEQDEVLRKPFRWPTPESYEDRKQQRIKWIQVDAPISRRYAALLFAGSDLDEIWRASQPELRDVLRFMREGIAVVDAAPSHLYSDISDLVDRVNYRLQATTGWVIQRMRTKALDQGMSGAEFDAAIEKSVQSITERIEQKTHPISQ